MTDRPIDLCTANGPGRPTGGRENRASDGRPRFIGYAGPSKIYLGLAAGLLGLGFPLWYALALGRPAEMPPLEMPAGDVRCVEDAAYMRAHHPRLLRQWRDAVVRDGLDSYVSACDGRKCPMSLTRTCLACHGEHRGFCDRCHDYARVGPKLDCWDCHLDPVAKGLSQNRRSQVLRPRMTELPTDSGTGSRIQTTLSIAPHQP